jgi:hypothetical protein
LRYFDFFFIFDFPVSLYLRGKIKGKQKMGKNLGNPLAIVSHAARLKWLIRWEGSSRQPDERLVDHPPPHGSCGWWIAFFFLYDYQHEDRAVWVRKGNRTSIEKEKRKKKSKTENLERKTKIVAGFIFPVIMCYFPHLHESSSSSRSLHSDQKCGFSMFPSYLFFNSFYIRETKPFSFLAFFLNSFHDVPH